MDKNFEYDQFVHGVLEDEETFRDKYEEQGLKDYMDNFETRIEPIKTFTFLRDCYMYVQDLEPARQGISADGDPFLVYKPKHPKNTDIKEVYIEIYDGSACMAILTALENNITEFFSITELCHRLDELMEHLT